MSESKAVVLTSGGIDSAVCLANALIDYDEVQPVHFDYGQQTQKLEWNMALEQVKYFESGEWYSNAHFVDETIVGEMKSIIRMDYSGVFSTFGEGVASDRDSFVSEDGDLTEDDGRSTGYVPMRNLHFLASGAAVADVGDGDAVFYGAQGGDEATYPDCRLEFVEAAQAAVDNSLPGEQQIDIQAPLLNLSKPEVVEEGERMGIPWQYTYSCYTEVEDIDNPEPCGACPACEERIEAFEEAGVEDAYY